MTLGSDWQPFCKLLDLGVTQLQGFKWHPQSSWDSPGPLLHHYYLGVILLALGFPGGSAGKESAWNMGDLGLIPGLERSPGEGKRYPLQYSGLENSMACIVHGLAKSQTQLEQLSHSLYFPHRPSFHMFSFLWHQLARRVYLGPLTSDLRQVGLCAPPHSGAQVSNLSFWNFAWQRRWFFKSLTCCQNLAAPSERIWGHAINHRISIEKQCPKPWGLFEYYLGNRGVQHLYCRVRPYSD